MVQEQLPIPLARAFMALMPAHALQKVVTTVFRRICSRHPKLIKNLSELPPAIVHLKPTDIPHAFSLRMGVSPVVFELLQDDRAEAQACVTGSLEAMVDMLEGRVDGDTLFFTRDIQITGDTSVIVALRNTLDREEIDLFAEITSLCGPFAGPARRVLSLMDKTARLVRQRCEAVHNEWHASSRGEGAQR